MAKKDLYKATVTLADDQEVTEDATTALEAAQRLARKLNKEHGGAALQKARITKGGK